MSQLGDPTAWSVKKQSQAIHAGRLSPVELVEAYLQRIEKFDGKLHAYVEVYFDDARVAAKAAHKAIKAGHSVGPLHGIPIAIKDLVDIQGRITTGGCAMWRDRRATVTATLAQRLLAQGMVLLGKTHMVEFAFGGWGTNTQMGTPWNPWDMNHARTPGGSSSGSGVAVAAGLAPWAIGTDTGGSVRLPASYCGLTALKTTAGRISNFGVLPLSPTLDTPGPMTVDAEDAVLLYGALKGPDPLDERTLAMPPQSLASSQLHKGVAGLRLARLPDNERGTVSAAVLDAYDRSLDQLANMGAHIVSIKLPCGFADLASLNGLIMSSESYSILHTMVDDEKAMLDEDVRKRVLAGRGVLAHDYIAALYKRKALIREFELALSEVDGLLTPTTARTALRLEDVDQSTAPSYFTRFANFLDLPAVSVPNGLDEQGLPTSLQIMSKRFDELTALRIACAYQTDTNWHKRRAVI